MATQLNDWLSIDKVSGTGNAQITLTASSYSELVDRATSIKIQAQSTNAILNVRQNALVPSATLDSYEITAYREGTYTNGITSNVPWTAVVNGDWITIDKTQGESGYTPLSITVDATTETRNGSIIFNAEGVVLTLQIYQIYDLKKEYFWIEFENTGGTISGLTNTYTDMYHSFDGITWLTTPNTLSMDSNRLVYFKNNSKKISDENIYLTISFNSNAKVGGDLSSLTNMTGSCCYELFKDNTYLTDASELILPWGTLAESCYYHMFYNCTSLTIAPVLPATTLANDCYSSMFSGCTNLVNAPALPATTLADSCYYSMFQNCTSLTSTPALPATTLADSCYFSMFDGCSNLTTAPELPATTLADSCYSEMFQNCTSLTTAPALPAITLANYCYVYMFYSCTSLTTAPELPATTLAISCYMGIFQGCTSLVNAPALPATTLAKSCYSQMFWDCTSLTTAPALPATTLIGICYYSMFRNCSSLTTAPALPATTLAYNCYFSMFQNCTSLTSAPALPTTVLTSNCYDAMFRNCTSLVNAPALPATTLADSCYHSMFSGCTSLNYVKMLATDISASNCLYYWVHNVAPTGTFIKHPDANIPTGISGIPKDWTVETATE